MKVGEESGRVVLSRDLLALLTPEDEGATRWRVRLFPPVGIPGLDSDGEFAGLGMPDYTKLDALMLDAHSAYRKRVHSTGVTEITVSTLAGTAVLCEWVARAIAEVEATRGGASGEKAPRRTA